MRLRTVIILVVGMLIIGGAMASTAVQPECNHCGGDGKIECSACGGGGAAVCGFPFYSFWVECACKGENTDCPFCSGAGGYFRSTVIPCLACDGKGGETCPHCSGKGRVGANKRLLEFLNLK